MATKKSPSSAIADIEKNIAALTAQLQKARSQKISDGEKALKVALAAVTAAATQVHKLETKGAGKAEVKKAKNELAHLQQNVVTIETELSAAAIALEIAKETAKLLMQPATSVKKPKGTVKTAKKVAIKPLAKNNKTTTPSPTAETALPKAKPVMREAIGTAVTIPPAPESSVLPEHGTTKMIEPRDNSLPKPTPV
jgi:chemotaxis receptor (MCP) glutamine deamidase CheD